MEWIPLNGRVLCDLGETTRLVDVDYKTAYKFADAWLKAAIQAERNAKGQIGMTKKDVDKLEEAICGSPSLFSTPSLFLGG